MHGCRQPYDPPADNHKVISFPKNRRRILAHFRTLISLDSIAAIARQPEIEAKARQYFFLTVGLVEAMYFINLLFMVVFVYVFAAKSVK